MAHSNRLRRGRVSEMGRCYLITSTTHKRRKIFSFWLYGRCVVCGMMAVNATTLSYVVMPDHIHWLVQLDGGDSLSSCVQKMKSVATKKLRQLGVAGEVWQAGFHDRAVRRDEDVIAIARYIVANPLRADLVDSVRDYGLWDAVWIDQHL